MCVAGLAKISDILYRLYCLYVLFHRENKTSTQACQLCWVCPSIIFSQFSLTKNQNVYKDNYNFKHVKGYSESGPLCSWMTFLYYSVLFSNWSWLVCSSSVLNVMCSERLSVPSKPVCGMTLQNTVSNKVSVALKFLSRPLCFDKKNSKLSDTLFL